MSRFRRQLVPAMFAFAGLLFLLVAVKSVIQERPIDATELVLAIVFLLLGVVLVPRTGRGARSQRD